MQFVPVMPPIVATKLIAMFSEADYYRVLRSHEKLARRETLGARTRLQIGSDLEAELSGSSDEDASPVRPSRPSRRANPIREHFAALWVSGGTGVVGHGLMGESRVLIQQEPGYRYSYENGSERNRYYPAGTRLPVLI